MTVSVEFVVTGWERIVAKLHPGLYAEPVREALERSAITIENRAKTMTPVDTGRLRASITHTLDPSAAPLWAKVGTNVSGGMSAAGVARKGYGLYVHEGRKPGKMPPVSALVDWARRHGNIPPFLLARAIGRRGIKAKPFLRTALQQSIAEINANFSRAQRLIEQRWRS